MADIKTGIFAKNVQKRLNRAQEKVSKGRRAVRQVARGSAGTDGGTGLRQTKRCRATGSGAACCGAGAGVGWRSPRSQRLQPGSIHSGSVGTAQRGGTPGTRRTPEPQAWSEPEHRNPLRVATILGTPPGTRGGRCSCCLAAPRADCIPWLLHLSEPAPPELTLSCTQLRRLWPQIREGDCRIPVFLGGDVVAI